MNLDLYSRNLSVGITGHREFIGSQSPVFHRSIGDLLYYLERNVCKPEDQVVLSTGLASGADCLVAEMAIKRGWSIRAILAAPAEEFERDFASSTEINTFYTLLHQADEVTVAAPSGTPSPDRYCCVGDLLISRVDHLIAIWDGNMFNPRAGGTAWVVARFLAREATNSNRLHHIKVQRV
jgi:hypothetical protein